MVKDYVSRFPALFGHDGAALDHSRVTREDVTAHNGLTTLVWQQQPAGIPVDNTIFNANVPQDGQPVTGSYPFCANPAPAAGIQVPNPIFQISHDTVTPVTVLGEGGCREAGAFFAPPDP